VNHTDNPSSATRRSILLSGALALAGGARAQSQPRLETAGWPTRPVRLVVGFPGGSTPDLVARALAEPMSRALGQPVIVDNRPGASGNIAADVVAKATDQHTIGVLINGNMTIAKLLNPATPYDPLKDLVPLSLICVAPLVLSAPSDAAGTDPKAFLAAARAAGDKWSYGTPGLGTVGHLGMEVLKDRAGINPVHVPYLGNPQVVTAMLSGQVQLALLPPGLALPQIQAGKLRAVGITASERSALVPGCPTLAEAGVQGMSLEIWTATAAPASLPAPIVARLSALISEISRTAKVRETLFMDGYTAVGIPSEGLAERVKADTKLLGGIIASRGIKIG
jgi:tripartite-type tricarboxylate transporter receptor subunit TctC